MKRFKSVAALSVATALCTSMASAQAPADAAAMTSAVAPAPAASIDQAAFDKIVAAWSERPRLGATVMLAKYGLPQEATSERVIWHNAGPYKRIMAINLETPHDFPLPHVDFLEHTIEYNVPINKIGDLIAFDGSSTINRTVGELSARCDLEGHNVLTLNLDHDIVTGKKSVEEARKEFGEIVVQDVSGKHPPYVEGLQFEPSKTTEAAHADKPVIPGSPMRPEKADAKSARSADKMGDAGILATVLAVDLNEVLAAAQAEQKKLSPPVMAYAKMMHEEHGMHMGDTMKLGQKISVTPVNTESVTKLQVKGAGELAAMVPLDGMEFEKAYTSAMVKGHTEALDLIDNQLLKAVSNDDLKSHLTKSRATIAAHLEKAKSLSGGM